LSQVDKLQNMTNHVKIYLFLLVSGVIPFWLQSQSLNNITFSYQFPTPASTASSDGLIRGGSILFSYMANHAATTEDFVFWAGSLNFGQHQGSQETTFGEAVRQLGFKMSHAYTNHPTVNSLIDALVIYGPVWCLPTPGTFGVDAFVVTEVSYTAGQNHNNPEFTIISVRDFVKTKKTFDELKNQIKQFVTLSHKPVLSETQARDLVRLYTHILIMRYLQTCVSPSSTPHDDQDLSKLSQLNIYLANLIHTATVRGSTVFICRGTEHHTNQTERRAREARRDYELLLRTDSRTFHNNQEAAWQSDRFANFVINLLGEYLRDIYSFLVRSLGYGIPQSAIDQLSRAILEDQLCINSAFNPVPLNGVGNKTIIPIP